MMMSVHTRIRTLGAAALLAVAVVAATAAQADARPKDPGTPQPKLCSLPGSAVGHPELDWVFYTPGSTADLKDSNGGSHIVVCGQDGTWVVVYGPPSTSGAPNLPSGGVNAP